MYKHELEFYFRWNNIYNKNIKIVSSERVLLYLNVFNISKIFFFNVLLSFVVVVDVVVAYIFFSWSFVDFLYRDNNKKKINWARRLNIIKLVHTNKKI